MAKFISLIGLHVSIVIIKDNSMQKVAMIFGQEWVVIYLYSLVGGIVVARLISTTFDTD